MHIGKAIKIALINAGKTQVWLANETGVSKQAINQLCNKGSAQTSVVDAVAKALGMTITELLMLGD